MNDREFVRANMPPEIFGAVQEPRLFDRNLTSSQPNADILDRYRMPEVRQQTTVQSMADTSTWRARYQAAPVVTRFDSVPGAVATEGQAAPGQAIRQVRYDQGVTPEANTIAQKDRPKSYSEMKAAAKIESSHSSKDEPSRMLVIGAELAIAAIALRYGLKYLPKSGINVLRESAKLTKGTETGAKGVEAGTQAVPKPFIPDLVGLSNVPKSLLGPNGTPLIRTVQRNDAPLRIG